MQILGTTIESLTDLQYVVRQPEFRFSELWKERNAVQKLSTEEVFFSDDTLLGLSKQIKQRLFKYVVSVLINNESNTTALFSLKKNEQDYYTYLIKEIRDGSSKPCLVCDINLKGYNLNALNALLMNLEKEIAEEKLTALAGVMLLLSDGHKNYLPIDETWIMLNADDIQQMLGVKRKFYNSINKIYSDVRFEPTSEFPLETRVFVNYGDQDIKIFDGNKEWTLKPHVGNRYDCIVGAFHEDKCYMMFENKAKCSISDKVLFLYFNHANSKTYLSINHNNNELIIPDVISFSCGEKDAFYITESGEMEFGADLFNEKLVIERKLCFTEAEERLLYVFFRNNKAYKCLTTLKNIIL